MRSTQRSHSRPQTRIGVPINEQIRFPQVRVLSERGEVVGVMTPDEALAQARAAEKDLVLVAANAQPPVVKIIELAKFKYQLQQRQADQRKKGRAQEIKEVRLKPFMAEGDIVTSLRKIDRFLQKGHKVRLSVDFSRGRIITKKQFGFELVGRIVTETATTAKVEIEPKLIGKKLIAQLQPNK